MTPKEFENGGFTLKTHQMFAVHTTPKEFKNATITGMLDLCLEKNIGQVNHMNYCYYIVFGRTPFSTPVHMKTKNRRVQIPPVCRVFSRSSAFMSCPFLVSVFISIDDRSNNRRKITAF